MSPLICAVAGTGYQQACLPLRCPIMLTGSPGSPDRERSGSREVRVEAVRLPEAWAEKLHKGHLCHIRPSKSSVSGEGGAWVCPEGTSGGHTINNTSCLHSETTDQYLHIILVRLLVGFSAHGVLFEHSKSQSSGLFAKVGILGGAMTASRKLQGKKSQRGNLKDPN